MRTRSRQHSDSHTAITLDTKAKPFRRRNYEVNHRRTLLGRFGIAYAQQDIDLTGYKLVFSDEFNTLSVGSANGKGGAKWGDWPPYGPAGAFSLSHWARRRLRVENGILFSDGVRAYSLPPNVSMIYLLPLLSNRVPPLG